MDPRSVHALVTRTRGRWRASEVAPACGTSVTVTGSALLAVVAITSVLVGCVSNLEPVGSPQSSESRSIRTEVPASPSAPPDDPSSPASVAPSASPTISFEMVGQDGGKIGISIDDPFALVESARPITNDEMLLVERRLTDLVALVPGDSERSVYVAWIGAACDRTVVIHVQPETIFVAPGPQRACDLVAIGRFVSLTFLKAPASPVSIEYVPGEILP